FTSKGAAFFVLHNGVDDIRILAVNIQPDASRFAPVLVRQSLRQFLPGRSAVDGLVNRAVRPATIETVGSPPALVHRGVQNVRALRLHGDLPPAGIGLD